MGNSPPNQNKTSIVGSGAYTQDSMGVIPGIVPKQNAESWKHLTQSKSSYQPRALREGETREPGWTTLNPPVPVQVLLSTVGHGIAAAFFTPPDNGPVIVAVHTVHPLDPALDQEWALKAVPSVLDGVPIIHEKTYVVTEFVPLTTNGVNPYVKFLGLSGTFNKPYNEAIQDGNPAIQEALAGLRNDYGANAGPKLIPSVEPPAFVPRVDDKQGRTSKIPHMTTHDIAGTNAWAKASTESYNCLLPPPASVAAPSTIMFPSCPMPPPPPPPPATSAIGIEANFSDVDRTASSITSSFGQQEQHQTNQFSQHPLMNFSEYAY